MRDPQGGKHCLVASARANTARIQDSRYVQKSIGHMSRPPKVLWNPAQHGIDDWSKDLSQCEQSAESSVPNGGRCRAIALIKHDTEPKSFQGGSLVDITGSDAFHLKHALGHHVSKQRRAATDGPGTSACIAWTMRWAVYAEHPTCRSDFMIPLNPLPSRCQGAKKTTSGAAIIPASRGQSSGSAVFL